MNKYDLVKRLRKECGVTEAEAERLIKAAIDAFTEALVEGGTAFFFARSSGRSRQWCGPAEKDATRRREKNSPFPPITQLSYGGEEA